MTFRSILSTLLGAVLLSLVVSNTVLPLRRVAVAEQFYQFQVKLTSTVSGVAQIYYDKGANYNEGDSSFAPLEASSTPTTLTFPIKADHLRALRFDPLNSAASFTLRDARILRPDGTVYREFLPDDITAANQIASLRLAGKVVQIETVPNSNDPFLFVDVGRDGIDLPRAKPNLVWPYLKRAWPLFLGLLALVALWHWMGRRWHQPALQQLGRLLDWTGRQPKTAIAIAALSATILSSYPVLLLGASFVSPNYGSALLYDAFPTLPGSKAAKTVDARGADIGAIIWQQVPLSMVQSRALFHDFELPLWNRYNSGGTVLLGQGQSMFGDPLHFVVLLAGGADWAWDVKYLAAKWLMGLALGLTVFYTARRLSAALIVAFASIFVGFFVFRVNHPAFFSFCYGPWVIFAWCLVVGATTPRKLTWALLGLMLANWSLLTSGTAKEAYVSLLTMNFTGVMLLLTSSLDWKQRLLRFGYASAAGVLLLMIASPIWLTFYDAMKASYSSYNAAYAFQLEPSLALGFFDELLLRPFWENELVFNPSSNFLLLLGVLAFLVNLRGVAATSRFAIGVVLGALLPVIFVFGLVPPRWIVLWPILGNIHHIDNSFGVGLIHLFAVMAGFGFAAWRERLDRSEGKTDLAIAALLLLGLIVHYIGLTQTVQRSTRTFLLWGQTIPRSDVVWLGFAVLLAAMIGLAWCARHVLTTRRLGYGVALTLVACVFALLWRHGMHSPSNQYPDYTLKGAPRASFGNSSAGLRALEKDSAEPGRAVGFNSNLFPGWTAVYDIECVNGPDALINPWMRELQTAFGVDRIWDWRLIVTPDTLPPVRAFFDLLNVRHFVDYHGDQAKMRAQLTPVAIADLEVYRSDSAWPRAFFTDRLAGYRKPQDFAQLVRSAGATPLAAVQLSDEDAPAGRVSNDIAPRRVTPAHDYQFTTNTTRFKIEAASPGVIVLAEAWLKDDFQVRLNGRPAEYFRVNHAFKGIWIDQAGSYDVTVSYRPHRFTLALLLAFVGLAGTGLCAWQLSRFNPKWAPLF